MTEARLRVEVTTLGMVDGLRLFPPLPHPPAPPPALLVLLKLAHVDNADVQQMKW